MRPRRSVEWVDGKGYVVVPDSGRYYATDLTMATELARELDRVDPLPCPHDGERITVVDFSVGEAAHCVDCFSPVGDDR